MSPGEVHELLTQADVPREEKRRIAQEGILKVIDNIELVIKGKRAEVRKVFICILARLHVLLEDVPGTGKTQLVKATGHSLELDFKRIQFTPDLMPGDIVGGSIYNQETHAFEFQPGPIFSQIILADEINRASPKVQSALLEGMEEKTVTVDGVTHPLPSPFVVLATQNPIESEGVFPLPSAQLDRFGMRFKMGYPSRDEEVEIIKLVCEGSSTAHPVEGLKSILNRDDMLSIIAYLNKGYVHGGFIYADDLISRDYIMRLAEATRADAKKAKEDERRMNLGASPRALTHLFNVARATAFLEGRAFVIPTDVRNNAVAVLAHRTVVPFSRSADDSSASQTAAQEAAIQGILGEVPMPEKNSWDSPRE